VQHKETGTYKGIFITMMEAHRRAMTGTKSARKRGVSFEPMVMTDQGVDTQFIMVLHINDLVSIETNDGERFYRVQKLDSSNKRVHLRLHTASTIANVTETFPDRELTVIALMKKHMKLHRVNAIGKPTDD